MSVESVLSQLSVFKYSVRDLLLWTPVDDELSQQYRIYHTNITSDNVNDYPSS